MALSIGFSEVYFLWKKNFFFFCSFTVVPSSLAVEVVSVSQRSPSRVELVQVAACVTEKDGAEADRALFV